MNSATIVQKLWNYCNVLRDDGMSYGDYVEQLTYLLFLKMADERSRPPYNQASLIPAPYDWPALLKRDGDELFDHYRHTLERLGAGKGTLALIFNKAQHICPVDFRIKTTVYRGGGRRNSVSPR
ncbi:MAG: type I restriction-modification system subunit M N-terminal domain-containing protein [Burkholderiales bacterium]